MDESNQTILSSVAFLNVFIIFEACLDCNVSNTKHWLKSKLPCLEWLPDYFSSNCCNNIAKDAMAAVTVSTVLVPQAIAYGQLSNAPAVYGIYTGFVPLLIYAFTGTSRHMCTGPFALIMSLVGNAVSSVCTVPAATPEQTQKIIDVK